MTTKRTYPSLPFYWERETVENDHRWLESIVRNAAPFSDWWTKARIIQLAYTQPPKNQPQTLKNLPIYGSYDSEVAIADALRSTCNLAEYPEFEKQVNEEYVVRTLNSWHNKQFTSAVSRNFEVYVDRENPNIFLVTSTAPTSLNVDRKLPSIQRFRPLFNIAELGVMMRSQKFERLTLRTHGYSTPADQFYESFVNEVKSLCDQSPMKQIGTLEDKSAYIGYQWPAEKPLFSLGLWNDTWRQSGIFIKFLLAMALLAWSAGTGFYLILALLIIPLLQAVGLNPLIDPLSAWRNLDLIGQLFGQWQGVAFVVFVLWLTLMQFLRLIVYQRDRYRAIHYGAPDLAEFFWRLDKVLGDNPYTTMPLNLNSPSPASLKLPPLKVNLIGHSMGGLLLVNMLRIISDKFGKEDRLESEQHNMGDYLELNKLILSAPDIPLEFLREGRNNYVRSAMRRCQEIYLFSSDRDIVLRYLSTLANWFSEPSLEMSGLRLGNVYLKSVKTRNGKTEYRPYVRVMMSSQPAAQATSAYDLFEKFNYLDCSEMKGVNQIPLKLNRWSGLIIDGLNTLMNFLGKTDVHSGYYLTKTPSFDILKCLITRHDLSPAETTAEIERLIQNTPLRFLPNQPFMTRNTRNSSPN